MQVNSARCVSSWLPGQYSQASYASAQLILRDINTSQSAYASVTLHSTFFDAYDVFVNSVVQTGVLIKV